MKVLIKSKKRLSGTVFKIIIALPRGYPDVQPGQFVRVNCQEAGSVLPRPISICYISKCFGRRRMALVIENRGTATAWLTDQKRGKYIDISDPIGHGFDVDPQKYYLLFGGGIGVPPLFSAGLKMFVSPDSLLCFSSKDKIIMEKDFRSIGGDVLIATDDGSYGYKGRADAILHSHLQMCIRWGSRQYDAILACGPKAMLAAVARIADEFGIPCYVSLEEYMACGVGACKGCAVQLSDRMGTVCKDGPVFNSKEVVWDV